MQADRLGRYLPLLPQVGRYISSAIRDLAIRAIRASTSIISLPVPIHLINHVCILNR